MKTIRVIAFKEADLWVAQCLEHDISAQADDLDTLRDRIESVLHAEMPIEKLPQAPARFFRMWEQKSASPEKGSSDGLDYEMALCA